MDHHSSSLNGSTEPSKLCFPPISNRTITYRKTSSRVLSLMAHSKFRVSSANPCNWSKIYDTFAWAMLNLINPPISLLIWALGKALKMRSFIHSIFSIFRMGIFRSYSICSVIMETWLPLSAWMPLSSASARFYWWDFSISTLTEMKYPFPYISLSLNWSPTVRRLPLVMIPMRSHRDSASSIKWVVSKRERFSRHLAKTSHRWRLFSGSKPVVGSSIKTILGSPTRLIPMDSLLFIPPDSWCTLKLRCD